MQPIVPGVKPAEIIPGANELVTRDAGDLVPVLVFVTGKRLGTTASRAGNIMFHG